MRLPWLQVEQEALTKGRLLARLLSIPEAQGVGIAVMSRQWALEEAPDGDFDGFIPGAEMLAAAVGWPVADYSRLIEEMQRVGFLMTTPALRIVGLERYRRAWEKNQRRNGNQSESGSRVPVTGRNPAETRAEPARQTQTQTQTQTHIQATALATDKPSPRSKSRKPVETDALCQDFEEATGSKYAWQGAKDGTAFHRLRKDFSLEEIRERWQRGLRASGWLSTKTIAQLAAKWNDLAPAAELPKFTVSEEFDTL